MMTRRRRFAAAPAGLTPGRWSATLLVVAGVTFAGFACRTPLPRTRPDVIVISIDTLRRDHLTAHGYPHDTSPRLTALAERSVVFENAIAVHTNTGPSHGSMLTGLYPQAHGILRNAFKLRPGVATLAELLGEAGYVSGGFVSGWTLAREAVHLDRGFDHYDDRSPSEVTWWNRPAGATFEAAREWLRDTPDHRSVFLFFHLFDPHMPYESPMSPRERAELTERFEGSDVSEHNRDFNIPERVRIAYEGRDPATLASMVGLYDAEIAYADRTVGLLLDELRELGRLDDALIVFVSDHGETLLERPWVLDHGTRLYDEQIRVPLWVKLPGDRLAGTRVGAQVSHVDLLPTVLESVGIDPPPLVHGSSLLELARRPDRSDSPPRPAFSIARPDPWRIPEISRGTLAPGDQGQGFDERLSFEVEIDQERYVTSIRQPPMKLIAYPTTTGEIFQLFDLSTDPDEKVDLAQSMPDLVRDLDAQIKQWWRSSAQGEGLPEETPYTEEELEALRALGYVR